MPLTAADAERLRQHTNGHPLHMRTLLRELTPDQLAAADLGPWRRRPMSAREASRAGPSLRLTGVRRSRVRAHGGLCVVAGRG